MAARLDAAGVPGVLVIFPLLYRYHSFAELLYGRIATTVADASQTARVVDLRPYFAGIPFEDLTMHPPRAGLSDDPYDVIHYGTAALRMTTYAILSSLRGLYPPDRIDAALHSEREALSQSGGPGMVMAARFDALAPPRRP
jgi:hypothetical protein